MVHEAPCSAEQSFAFGGHGRGSRGTSRAIWWRGRVSFSVAHATTERVSMPPSGMWVTGSCRDGFALVQFLALFSRHHVVNWRDHIVSALAITRRRPSSRRTDLQSTALAVGPLPVISDLTGPAWRKRFCIPVSHAGWGGPSLTDGVLRRANWNLN
jgi:hypothetical protein